MINANTIIELLAEKHSNDVFVPSCKTGPTQTGSGSLLILDAWVMNRSWANAITTGYEIKVNRSDFINDKKWHCYLDFCNEFYFVCPHALIKPEELPHEVGLLYVSKTGRRLFTKKKAPRRMKIGLDESLVRYILMARTKIGRESFEVSDRKYWETWLKQKEIDFEFGSRVGRAIHEIVEKRIMEVKRENDNLKDENENLAEVKKLLEKLGIDHISHWSMEEVLKEKIELVEKGIPKGLIEYLDDSISGLENIKRIFVEERK